MSRLVLRRATSMNKRMSHYNSEFPLLRVVLSILKRRDQSPRQAGAGHASTIVLLQCSAAVRLLSSNSKISAQDIRMMGIFVRACVRGCKEVFLMYSRGEIGQPAPGILFCRRNIVFCCYNFGLEVVTQAAMGSDVLVISEPLSEEEKQKELDALEEARHDLQRMGTVKVLAGTAPPPTWTTDQATPARKREFEVVPIGPGKTRDALQACLRGNDIGRGGRDAVTGKPYSRLELVDAWRIENATLWGKFAAERMQVRATMERLDKRARARVATPHIRRGLRSLGAAARGGRVRHLHQRDATFPRAGRSVEGAQHHRQRVQRAL